MDQLLSLAEHGIKQGIKQLEKDYTKNFSNIPRCNPTQDVPEGYIVRNMPDKEFSQNDEEINIECDGKKGWQKKNSYTGNHIQCSQDKRITFEGCEIYKCNIGNYIQDKSLLSIEQNNQKEMKSLLQKKGSKLNICNNLQDLNTNCSLMCKFGYEPSNLDEYIQGKGTKCNEDSNITEKVGLQCQKTHCKQSDLKKWLQKEEKKKSIQSSYENISTDHCFKDKKMYHGKTCSIMCNHKIGHDRVRKDKDKNYIPIEKIKCQNGSFIRINRDNINTQCKYKEYPNLKDFPCLSELDTFIKSKEKSLLHTKNTCISKQTDKDFGHCYLKDSYKDIDEEKHKFRCIKEQIKNNKNEVKDVYKLVM